MGGVAAEHDPAHDESVGDGRVHLPTPDGEYLHVKILDTGAGPDPFGTRLGVVFLGLPVVTGDGYLAQPAASGVQGLEDPGGSGAGDVEQDAVPVPEVGFQVGPEVAVDELVDGFRAVEGEAQLRTYEAVRAIGGDKSTASDGVAVPGRVDHLQGRFGVLGQPSGEHASDPVTEP